MLAGHRTPANASSGVATLDGRSTPSDDKLTEPLREVAKYLKIKDRRIYRLVAKREILGFKGWWFLAVQKKRDRPVGSRERGLAG